MIRTFNHWFWVAPVILLIAALLAIFSVTEKNGKVKSRGSDRFWNLAMTVYVAIATLGLFWLLVAESILGAIELLGRDLEGSLFVAACGLMAVATGWAALSRAIFMSVRKRRIAHIKAACRNGRSKSDRKRRQREISNERRKAKLAKKRERLVKTGKLALMPNPAPAAGPNAEQRRAIEYRVQQSLKLYQLEKRDILDATYEDADGKHSIVELLPVGVYEYYVGINLKENTSPIFLGWGSAKDAEENLKRHLRDLIEDQICSKKPASNQ